MGTSCVTIIEYSKLIDINFVFHFNIDAEVNFLLPMSPISSVSHQADPPPPCTHANTHTSRPRPRRAYMIMLIVVFMGDVTTAEHFARKLQSMARQKAPITALLIQAGG